MAFVRGHPRDAGWVMSQRRGPNRAEAEQLPLIVAEGSVPVDHDGHVEPAGDGSLDPAEEEPVAPLR